MKLRMDAFTITDVTRGAKTSLDKGVLVFNENELRELILEDKRITGVDFEVVRPGESARIVHVMDAVEPRVKAEGGDCFPGLLAPPRTVGRGLTRRLEGMAVVGCARKIHIPIGVDSGVLEFNEGVIDMSGPGQERSMCSHTINLCLVMSHADGLTTLEFDESCRMATLRAADRLARTTLGQVADQQTVYEPGVIDPALPKVAYIDQIQSQGPMCRTFLYGMPMEGCFTPVPVSPTELMDGAVVSSNYRNQMRRCTYMQQNNLVVNELFARHGKDLNFVGMVMSRGHYDSDAMKVRTGQFAAKHAELMGSDAVILTLEGTGNSNIDYMYTVSALENAGIAAVPIVHEFGGPAGDDEPLFAFPREAVSLVSGGGIDRLVEVPEMRRVIGGDTVRFTTDVNAFTDLDPHKAFTAGAHYFFCGFTTLQENGFRALEF